MYIHMYIYMYIYICVYVYNIYVCIYICTPLNVPIIRVSPENAGLYKGPIQLMVRTYVHKVGAHLFLSPRLCDHVLEHDVGHLLRNFQTQLLPQEGVLSH